MSDRLPHPRADLATVEAYRTQHVASARVNANEWPDLNRAGDYITPDELDAILSSGWRGCAGRQRVSVGASAQNERIVAAIETVYAAAPARA